MKENSQIHEAIKRSGLKQWEVAARVGVSEGTFIRWMRLPLDEEHEQRIMNAIAELVKDRR